MAQKLSFAPSSRMRSFGTWAVQKPCASASRGTAPSPLKIVTVSRSLARPRSLRQELPGEGDRVLLEVVAEREVAEHLEERVVARGDAHVLEVVVLAAGAHALLGRGRARVVALLLAQEHVLELVHARVGEQQRGVVLGHERRALDDAVAALLEVAEEAAADLVGGPHASLGRHASSPCSSCVPALEGLGRLEPLEGVRPARPQRAQPLVHEPRGEATAQQERPQPRQPALRARPWRAGASSGAPACRGPPSRPPRAAPPRGRPRSRSERRRAA